MRKINIGGLLLAGALVAATSAQAAGDAAAGKILFTQKCGLCHAAVEGKNKIGPSLWGVVGRKAGTVADYNYSEAMKNSGKTWDDATLDAYLTNPRQYIPGIKMIFAGYPDPADRQNVIAYLNTLK